MDFKTHLEEALKEAKKDLNRQIKQAEKFPISTFPVHLLVSLQIARENVATYEKAIRAYKKYGGK